MILLRDVQYRLGCLMARYSVERDIPAEGILHAVPAFLVK